MHLFNLLPSQLFLIIIAVLTQRVSLTWRHLVDGKKCRFYIVRLCKKYIERDAFFRFRPLNKIWNILFVIDRRLSLTKGLTA